MESSFHGREPELPSVIYSRTRPFLADSVATNRSVWDVPYDDRRWGPSTTPIFPYYSVHDIRTSEFGGFSDNLQNLSCDRITPVLGDAAIMSECQNH